MRRHYALLGAVLWALGSGPATAQNQPFTGYPVVFAVDGQIANAELVTAILNVHFETGVPAHLGVVPCGTESTAGNCVSLKSSYPDLGQMMLDNPGLLVVAQHGFRHTADDRFAGRSREDQLARIETGLNDLLTWGLPVRPFTWFGFFNEDETTFSVLEELGFRSVTKHSGACFDSNLDAFCQAVLLCEPNDQGNLVSGPGCVFRSVDELLSLTEARRNAGDPLAHIDLHDNDFWTADREIDADKIDAYREILLAFKARTDLKIVNFDRYWRRSHCAGERVTIFGTPGDDTLVGTVGDDVIRLFGGNDAADAREGNDLICGNLGDDFLAGGVGTDTIRGGGGDADTCDAEDEAGCEL